MTEVTHKGSPSPAAPGHSPSPVERFEQRWREVPAPAPPAGPTHEQHRRYDLSLARQAQIERERWDFTAQRRSYQDELDLLFMLSGDPRADFMRLHEKPQGNEACMSVVLRYAFACHLDRVRSEHQHVVGAVAALPPGPDRLVQARARLAREQPDLSLVVEETCFRHPSRSEQALATELGCSRASVGRRKWRGIAWLRRCLEDSLGRVPCAQPAG